MKNMTFRELKSYLSTLTDEQLDSDVAVYEVCEGEGFSGIGFAKTEQVVISLGLNQEQAKATLDGLDGLYDAGHPVILFQG